MHFRAALSDFTNDNELSNYKEYNFKSNKLNFYKLDIICGIRTLLMK